MILKHHLGNDKKDQLGWTRPKLKSFPLFSKKSMSDYNMLSYKYLNTKFSPDVCTSPGLFSPQSTPPSPPPHQSRAEQSTSTVQAPGSDWSQSHAGNFAVTSYGCSPLSIFCTFLRQNVVWPAGCFCVYFKTLLWRVSQSVQSGPAQLRSFIILHQNRSFQ